jgi:hypothetical protein
MLLSLIKDRYNCPHKISQAVWKKEYKWTL